MHEKIKDSTNKKNTKKQASDANILIEGTPIEQVTSMIYIGHMVTDDGKNDKEKKEELK